MAYGRSRRTRPQRVRQTRNTARRQNAFRGGVGRAGGIKIPDLYGSVGRQQQASTHPGQPGPPGPRPPKIFREGGGVSGTQGDCVDNCMNSPDLMNPDLHSCMEMCVESVPDPSPQGAGVPDPPGGDPNYTSPGAGYEAPSYTPPGGPTPSPGEGIPSPMQSPRQVNFGRGKKRGNSFNPGSKRRPKIRNNGRY